MWESDFAWELRPGTGWRGLIVSLLLHGLAFAGWFGYMSRVPPEPDSPAALARSAIPLFVPAPVPVTRVTTPEQKTLRPSPQLTAPGLLPEPVPFFAEVRVDMNSIALSFADDVTNQLPDIIERHGGMLALVDKQDPAIARYVIEPPDWTVRETLVDVSRKVRFAMYPPRKWALLRSVARSSGLDLDRYVVCALFDSPYKGCLQEAIRSKAVALMAGMGQVRVQSARLAFEGRSHCGVDVLEVSFAPVPGRDRDR